MTDPVQSTGYNVVNFIDAEKLSKDVAFSPNDLDSAMMQQASMFSYYGVLAADAARQVDAVKMMLEDTESIVYKAIRAKYDREGTKFTETLLEKGVATHPRVKAMKQALAEAKRVENIGRTAQEAFRHRRDMLVQTGYMRSHEMKGQAIVSKRDARADALEDQKARALERAQKAVQSEE